MKTHRIKINTNKTLIFLTINFIYDFAAAFVCNIFFSRRDCLNNISKTQLNLKIKI